MRRMKSILFVTERGREIKEVDLELLEETARKVAEMIYTTENGDDLSEVFIRSDKTNVELMREEGKSEEDIERVRKYFGDSILADNPRITWTWDKLRVGETPEEYFNRHAKEVDRIGGNIEGNWLNRCVSR